MKKYLSIIFAVLAAAGVLTGKLPDKDFSREDYQKLLALQFDGYQDMTVAEYQDRVWKLTDTMEYRDLLERFSQDEALYKMKDSDETAAFLFYVLDPLTAENWRTRNYSGAAASGFPVSEDNATLEYTLTLTILDADMLTVRDYNDRRLGVVTAMQEILKNRTREELRNESYMLAEIQTYLDDVLRHMQTAEISVEVEYAYFPLSAPEEEKKRTEAGDNGEQEKRRYPNGTEKDYRTLLTLKTADYKNLPLADFNRALLEWTSENDERMERISEDTGWNDFQVTLTDEELSFVKVTVFLSGMENGKAIQSSYAGQLINPYYEEELPQKTANRKGAAWCSLYYRFFYSILDAEAVTVGQRDRQIEGMINAVRTFWEDTDLERVLKMSEGDIVQELKRIAAEYSTDHVTITTDEEQVHFERMDERREK